MGSGASCPTGLRWRFPDAARETTYNHRTHSQNVVLALCHNPTVTDIQQHAKRPIYFAIFLIVAGVIGWFAAFDLTLEKIQTLINPAYAPSCNISPLVQCGLNMSSPQGAIFGFPNSIIGVAAFIAPILVGVSILAGARFARWYWVAFNLGMLGAIAFVGWLSYESIFVLGTLCPYCLVVWAVVIPLFFYITVFNLKQGHFGNGERSRDLFRQVYPWTWILVLLGYLVIVVEAQLRLDAITSIFFR